MNDQSTAPVIAAHGAAQLPSVVLDSYNVEIKDDKGFVGDRASNRAFRATLEEWRKAVRKKDGDPLGEDPSTDISKKKIDKALSGDDLIAAGVVLGAVEDFSQALAAVIRRFLKLKDWKDTERIVIGGGLRESRVGELAIGRAAVLLKAADKIDVDLVPIRHHPDEAGLIGAAHLAPSWLFSGHDAILGVDIGGTNFRAGIVSLNLKEAKDLSKASVAAFELWRHRDEKPTREDAVKKLIGMLEELIAKAGKDKIKLAPFIGIGCPGIINADGSIERGSQNLPGNWASSKFHLPTLLREAIPEIDGHDTAIVMHNDAVVQGLSALPGMQDVGHWGALTMGTGLGNARFTNRASQSAG
ncbi:glucokinase [Terrihabitans soli]|uniref:Glucokinase n=1 Tax=Terrihabitans soli TaxID=708113 RepID=A0A6S6QXH6_9HYPH|nr:ROK family protein [Terrihabitans soli]BCJ91268.1 glucokinase [Terrihabitans soli]